MHPYEHPGPSALRHTSFDRPQRARALPAILAGFGVVLLAACATLGGSASQRTSFRTRLPADSALRIAATQLQIHGYAIGVRGKDMISTEPRAVPQDLRAARAKLPVRRWVLRVEAASATLGGTDVRVAGFLVPDGATGKGDPPEGATRVDKKDRQLFSELAAVAGWVRDAAERKAREM
ncbi:MAG: hypothetical protein ACR2G6_05235 [Gemmatimonadaceae bacterium]